MKMMYRGDRQLMKKTSTVNSFTVTILFSIASNFVVRHFWILVVVVVIWADKPKNELESLCIAFVSVKSVRAANLTAAVIVVIVDERRKQIVIEKLNWFTFDWSGAHVNGSNKGQTKCDLNAKRSVHEFNVLSIHVHCTNNLKWASRHRWVFARRKMLLCFRIAHLLWFLLPRFYSSQHTHAKRITHFSHL